MRRLPFAVALLFIAGVAHAQNLGPVDWIFLVDTSRSMRGGAPKSKDIWADVKLSIDSFAREASATDSVAIYAFDSDVRQIDVPSPAFMSRALLPLEADGERTYLGLAIQTGLQHAAALRARGDANRRQAVVLFTDGKDNPPHIDDPIPIEANVSRVGETLVFFVSMGDHEPQLDAFAAATERASVLKAPTPEAIRAVAREIRAKIPLPPPPPGPEPPVKAQPRPAAPPPPPPSSPWPEVLAALALLAAVVVAFLLQQRKKNRLEGELEILAPRTSADLAFVGLPKLQANEIALSAILPPDALAGSDARLFVRRKAGKKKVWIAAQGGPLRINDVETPMTELFDADTIEIGGARLRFNRVGDERPEMSQEGEL